MLNFQPWISLSVGSKSWHLPSHSPLRDGHVINPNAKLFLGFYLYLDFMEEFFDGRKANRLLCGLDACITVVALLLRFKISGKVSSL